jgi:hypothetical protein
MVEPTEITMWQVLENGKSIGSMSSLSDAAALYLENVNSRLLHEIKCEGKGTWDFVRAIPEDEARKIDEYAKERKRKRDIRLDAVRQSPR